MPAGGAGLGRRPHGKPGAELVKHYRDLAFMGFAEVVKGPADVPDNIAFCKRDIEAWKPDAVVLVDYPGFNLRIAEFAHQQGASKVFYYISPQVWAWKKAGCAPSARWWTKSS